MKLAMLRNALLCCYVQVLLIVGSVNAEINQRTSAQEIRDDKLTATTTTTTTTMAGASFSKFDNWKKDCSKSYSSMCLKLDVVSFVDRLAEQDNIGLLPGVSVVKQNGSGTTSAADIVANLARDFPNDVDKRMDAYLMHKIGTYLNSHAISIKLFDPRTFEATKSFNDAALAQLGFTGNSVAAADKHENNVVESARKKDKGGYGNMMAALMMMKGTLGALGFGALAMLAGKALMTGLMALMLSAIVGLKSLASGGEKKTTYEIVSKPVYSSAHTHSSEEHHGGYSGGYARSFDNVDVKTVQEAIKKYGNVRDRRTVDEQAY